jgi:hypothetical protein
MPATYEPIATTTLGSASSPITFTSIPAIYTDLRLVLVFNTGGATGNTNARITFNSDTGSNYSKTNLRGDGSSAYSQRATNENYIDIGQASQVNWAVSTMDIFNYAGSTYKTSLTENNSDWNGAGNVYREVALWRDTTAISTITITSSSANNFRAGTTATLYGILKA